MAIGLRSASAMLLLAGTMTCASFARANTSSAARTSLTYATLSDGRGDGEVDLSAFAPAAAAQPPTHVFEGTLRVSGKVRTRTIHADTDYLSTRQLAAARSFPQDFDYAFVQDGDVLLPGRRGYIVTRHPHWDVVLEPGRVWNEAGDDGDTRAALPFALVQKQMNCTHYGVMTFVFGDSGKISHAAIQISSETCKYLKLDMWGLLDATYTPHAVASKQSVLAAYQANLARRIPTRPIAQLASDHPGVDASALAIGEANARTQYGMEFDGVHYVSDCPTRHGSYPFCDVLPFPSYSTAKSAVASLAFMALEQMHPGTQALKVTALAPVPACAAPDWRDVTLRNLLDMTSGHYDDSAYMADEDAAKVQGFFFASGEQQKTEFACSAYPRRADPGTVWTYRTSDTFLLGDELERQLRLQTSNARADIFDDVLVAKIYRPLGLSATAQVTRRSADATAQAFFGYGLQWHRDDIVRLARFIANDQGKIDGKQVLDARLLDLVLQRVQGQHGSVVTAYPDFRYQLGFWARDVAPLLGCKNPTWVPFMSGFGGISVVMYPNGVIYYNVADSGSAKAFDWGKTASQARKLGDFCH